MGTLETQINLPLQPMKFEMSATIGQLVEALAKARKAFKPIVKGETNPFFKSKYADLATVIDATKDGLSDNGLVVFQPPVYGRDGAVQVVTILAHSSGEWIKSILDMPVSKTDAQGVGSAITYGRRYAYSGVLSVASEEDDDANAAVSGEYKKTARKEETEAEFDQRTADQQAIAPFQITAIDEACKRTGKTEEEVLAYLNLIGHKRIEYILKSEFQEFLKWANTKTKASEAKAAVAKVGGTIKPASQIVPDGRTKAMKRLWATAAELSIPEQDVKTCAYEKYQVDSMTKLNEAQLTEMAQWVKDVAAAVAES